MGAINPVTEKMIEFFEKNGDSPSKIVEAFNYLKIVDKRGQVDRPKMVISQALLSYRIRHAICSYCNTDRTDTYKDVCRILENFEKINETLRKNKGDKESER